MSFWADILRAIASDVLRPSGPESGVKIQIRRAGDTIWRDHSFVSANPESVQNGLHAAGLGYSGADVRAIDKSGRMVDFR